MAVDLGRREVRAGRSLDALLSAYRTGARVAWRRLAALGLEAGLAPETLVVLAEAIFAYVDELSAESAEGFAREQAERAGELERRRRALAELLVATPPPDARRCRPRRRRRPLAPAGDGRGRGVARGRGADARRGRAARTGMRRPAR